MKKYFYTILCFTFLMSFACSETNTTFLESEEDFLIDDTLTPIPVNFKILSLGDSYTIGQSVCEKCRFPEQLKDSLLPKFETDTTFSLKVIARTGWTTTNLMNAIEDENISEDFDLITLLIGVNNQYQGKDFALYKKEFPLLVSTAMKAGKNDKSNVIVVSIPDYAFTPFGGGNKTISKEIDLYNEFAKNYCIQIGIPFVNITDITRNGLIDKDLVASDGLHPSALAYTKFVERLLPLAIEKLKN